MSEAGTKERLIDTAMRLFHEQGYSATGVATILREAGVRSGSLYHHFANKEELLSAVLQRYEEMLRPILLEPVEAECADPLGRVFLLLRRYREGLVQTGCRLGCPIGNLALEVADSYPAVREHIEANFRGWTRGIAGWLEPLRGRLRPGTRLEDLASFVLSVMEGAMMQCRTRDDVEPFDAALRVLEASLEAFLLPEIPPSGDPS